MDIDTIAEKLKEIDNKMKSVDYAISLFCSELNIKTPF